MKKSNKKAEWVGSLCSYFNPGRSLGNPGMRSPLPLGLTLWGQEPLLGAVDSAANALLGVFCVAPGRCGRGTGKDSGRHLRDVTGVLKTGIW